MECFLFLVQGKWTGSATWNTLVDPLNGETFIKVAEVDETGIQVCPLDILCLMLVLFHFRQISASKV